MKLVIMTSTVIIGTFFGWVGALIDNGNWFGGWSIILWSIGSVVGIWAGYKAYKYFA